MIQPQTKVRVTDNSGAKIAQVFKILGGTRRRYAEIGDVVVIAVKSRRTAQDGEEKDVLHAVVCTPNETVSPQRWFVYSFLMKCGSDYRKR